MKKHRPTAKRIVGAAVFVIIIAVGWCYPYLAYCLLLNVADGLAHTNGRMPKRIIK